MRRMIYSILINAIVLTLIFAAQDTGLTIKGRVTDLSGNALTGARITIESTYLWYSY